MKQTKNTEGLIEMPDLSTSIVCKNLYESFYASIKTSQDGKTNISLDTRIKNSAYNLAKPIAENFESADPTEPQLATFVKKAGDNMSGRLSTLFGFQAGEDGKIFLQTFKKTNDGQTVDSYISIEEKLKIDSNNLLIDNKLLFNHYIDASIQKEIMKIDAGDIVDFLQSNLQTSGDVLFGPDISNGFYVSPTTNLFSYKGGDIYYSGNSNKADVNWTMLNAIVKGELSVTGNSNLLGPLFSLYGVQLGANGNAIASITQDELLLNGNINIGKQFSIKLNGQKVISCPSDFHIQLSSIGGSLILGGESTSDIRLWSTLTTEAGDHNLIDKFGRASFMNSFQAGFGYGDILMSTNTQAVIIHDKLRFRDNIGPYINSDTCGIALTADFLRSDSNRVTHKTGINYGKTTSVYADLSKNSESVFIDTSADFFTFNKPLEGKDFVGIQESTTRLANNTLFFSDNNYLLNISDGIKHFGNAYFIGNLSSERFSTGFAGEGWGIRKKIDTGNIEITADEAVFRKKIRAYEFEIQKISSINGSLWVSSSCSGDKVEQIK